jgi:predicted RNase H-like HicB family nuclease
VASNAGGWSLRYFTPEKRNLRYHRCRPTLERDEDGRYVVRFPDLPEALTDGMDEKEALVEAADCLSEALASRIVDGEAIPSPSRLDRGQYLISPDPIIALKAALYTADHRRRRARNQVRR